MKRTFQAEVVRIVHQRLVITVEANDEEEAYRNLIKEAPNHDFSGTEKDADYEFEREDIREVVKGVVLPRVKEVAEILRGHQEQLPIHEESSSEDEDGDEDEDESEEDWLDVRLQVQENGEWSIHVGSSDYDQDHRGDWGSSSINWESDLDEVAEELIDQVADSIAQRG